MIVAALLFAASLQTQPPPFVATLPARMQRFRVAALAPPPSVAALPLNMQLLAEMLTAPHARASHHSFTKIAPMTATVAGNIEWV